MTHAAKRRLAKILFGLVLAELTIVLVFGALRAMLPDQGFTASFGDMLFVLTVLLFPILGVMIATREPDNALGWMLLAIGLFGVEPLSAYGEYALAAGLPGGEWALSAAGPSWVPVIGLAGTFVLLLFPDGHLPTPRWRWFAWAIAIGMVITFVGILLGPGTLEGIGQGGIENRFGIEALRPLLLVGLASIATIPIGIIGAAISLRVRYRRSGPTERLQIRWLASAAVVVAVTYAAAIVISLISNVAGWGEGGIVGVAQIVGTLSFSLIPISIGVAVLRYRLYDIDVVVRKTVIAAGIAVFFTAVYAVVVGGIGALVESYSTTALSFVAAAVVAVLFQPVLMLTRRLATRIAYGRRATPYEVLSEFSEHVAGTYADEDVLPRMARVVGEGVGASSAQVWLEREGVLHAAAAWPPGDVPTPIEVDLRGLQARADTDAVFPVEDGQELLGALTVSMSPSDPMDEAKAKLVEDLAAQARLVIRNVRLTEELRQRLRDLQAAQKRLVAAQDAERRRIERNIHDGAQQQLVALTVKMRLAQSLARTDPGKASEILEELQRDAQGALEDLRDLARGIYPPLLADQGLAAAVEAQARKSPVPVRVRTDRIGRYAQEVEAATYFSVLEALQNVAKYAQARHATVELVQQNGQLVFRVIDDGKGFSVDETGSGTGLQGIADRLGALGGVLEVQSTPGVGTTVTGRVPAAAG